MANVKYRWFPWYMQIVNAIFIILLMLATFSSCSPYKKVAGNANPTTKERNLLAVACSREFPIIANQFTIDSTINVVKQDYAKTIDSLIDVTEILDSIIHEQIPIIDTTFVDSTNCLPRIRIAYDEIEKYKSRENYLKSTISSLQDKLKQIQKGYVPCDEKIVYRTSVIEKCDSARMQLLLDRAVNAEKKNIVLETKLEDKSKQAQNRLYWIIALIGILGVAIVLRVKKII